MSKRACHGTTKAGKPCKAAPLHDSDYCLAHTDEETRLSTGFGAPGTGRPRNPRAVDVLKERIEAGIDEVLKPLWDALTAERAVVVGNGPGAAQAEFEKVRGPALAEYEKVSGAAWAEYEKVRREAKDD